MRFKPLTPNKKSTGCAVAFSFLQLLLEPLEVALKFWSSDSAESNGLDEFYLLILRFWSVSDLRSRFMFEIHLHLNTTHCRFEFVCFNDVSVERSVDSRKRSQPIWYRFRPTLGHTIIHPTLKCDFTSVWIQIKYISNHFHYRFLEYLILRKCFFFVELSCYFFQLSTNRSFTFNSENVFAKIVEMLICKYTKE